jgi:hypothetical protein
VEVQLPAPSLLLSGSSRSASFDYEDVVLNGSAFDHALPSQNVNESSFTLRLLNPENTELGVFGNCAFCIYRFVVPDYDEPLALRASFNTDMPSPAPAAGDMYWGVANWQTDRWDWYPCLSGINTFGDSAPYKLDSGGADDGTFLVVLLLRRGLQRVDWVGLGGNIPAYVYFTFAPETPIAGDPISFDPSFSYDADTEVVAYSWDFDDDGLSDAATGTPDLVEHTFANAGDYPVSLKVETADAREITYRATVSVAP